MLPKVTLLSGAGTDFLFRFGSKAFSFTGGEGERVPVAVALALQDQKMPGDKPLFRVEDMPEIVSPSVEEAVPVIQEHDNATRQLRFELWA